MGLAVVIIGRNEGARLIRGLASVAAADRVVYVDSGSTDGSQQAAQEAGAEVVALDMSQPFTAARARNAGLERLRLHGTRPELVQFMDGDCELQPGWLPSARAFLAAHPEVGVVFGRRRERFPDATVYNRMCDWEWDVPLGEQRACGGDALMRLTALDEVGGYNPALIAGEEPEMCVRLRAAGWKIWRIDAEMTLHDAAMTRLGQFWSRARRAGHAWAEGTALHGAPPERHCVGQVRRALIWGAVVPFVIILLAIALNPWALVFFVIYPLRALRMALREGATRPAWERAWLLSIGKFPEAMGVIEYHLRRLAGRPRGLIEYK
ncbi:GT2 family glycosyltransferase [Primorskyibacter sedentarius]|uniref:GT2 family glycosyltransferase n=1 Tax=Primorskyibacter sedentarius TaxID=745311 RepID=A0A4R3J204_9RHOB|nr:glycosyltransferase family 2 protein [Primorskyibacter sedentarius]TCS59808.1 GT2 family glycosyltransferase [Primorskyibacter sedentarius]